jgi:hypothetical protein
MPVWGYICQRSSLLPLGISKWLSEHPKSGIAGASGSHSRDCAGHGPAVPTDAHLPRDAPPAGEAWAPETKLDDYRCMGQVRQSRLRLWSSARGEWTGRPPELNGLASLRDVVLEGNVVVITTGGRADFELAGARIHGPK